MRKFVDRWALPIVLLAVLAAAALPFGGCGASSSSSSAATPVDDDGSPTDDDDNDNDDNDVSPGPDDDTSPNDDDASPDDDDDNDDNDDNANHITVTPAAQMIPAKTTFTFTASGVVNGNPVTTGFTWSTDDHAVATVDQSGVVTGVANGKTTVHAAIGNVRGDATAIVGPDVYTFDNLAGILEAVDRGSQTGVADLLGVGSIGAVLQDIKYYNGSLLLTDSGDSGPGIGGKEKLILVTLADLSYVSVKLVMDSPWAATALNGKAYVTGNLDNQLAKVDLADPLNTPVVYFPLDSGCAPAGAIAANNLIFIACTGFDLGNFTYAPGKVLVFDPTQAAITKRIDMPQINPAYFAATADGAKLYVVCTGDYASNTGQVVQLDPAQQTILDSFPLGAAPGPIGIGPSGLAFVGEGTAGDVYVFDTADNTVKRGADNPIAIANAKWVQALGVHPATGDAYACDSGNGQVWAIHGADPFDVDFHVALNNPGGVAFW